MDHSTPRQLRTLCAWCETQERVGLQWRDREGRTQRGALTSHGICPSCRSEQVARLELDG